MKKLATLILSAAIASPFTLSTVAIAENQDNMQADDKQPAGMQDTGEKNASEQPKECRMPVSSVPTSRS